MTNKLPPLITDERIWEMWREANNVHTVEVDMAFARMIEEEAVRLEREACAKLCEEVAADNGFYFPPNESRAEAKDCAAAIRARSEL